MRSFHSSCTVLRVIEEACEWIHDEFADAECVVKVVVCIEKGRGRREGEKERGRGRGILVDASNDSFSADPR